MSKEMLFDFKNFDYDGHDDDSTTLRHNKDGHTINLKHATLPKNTLAILKGLHNNNSMQISHFDDGGKEPPTQGEATTQPSKDKLRQVGQAASGGVNQPTLDPRSWWAKGGEVNQKQIAKDKEEPTLNYDELRKRKREMNIEEASQPVMPKRKRFAEGGETSGLPCLNPHCKSHGRPHPNCRCYGPGGPQSEGNYAEGGEVNSIAYCAYGFPHMSDCEFAKSSKPHYASGTGMVYNPEAYTEDQPLTEQPAQQEAQAHAPEEAPPVMEMPEEDVVAPKPEYAPPMQPTHTPMQTDTPDEYTKSLAHRTLEEDQRYASDLDAGHIQPKTYASLYADKSTPGKIATIFGVLASGMGSGLTHQPSAALQMMDNVINRDIDAQKASAQNKQTHWGMNYKHALETAQANGMDATADLTKSQAALQANAWTKMQADRNALAGMSDYIKRLPPGPQKQQLGEAFSYAVKATDAAHVNMAQQLDAQNQIINNKFGMPGNSTIHAPHPAARIPVSGPAKSSQEPKKDGKTSSWFKPGEHILSDSADNQYPKLQYNELYKNQMPAIAAQKERAALADKAIDTVNEVFPKLYEQTGGMGGYLRRQGHNLTRVPYIGPAVDAATNYITDTNNNEGYDSNYTKLLGALRGALQGNVSEDLLEDVARKNAPETNDSDALKSEKHQNFIDFVRSHVKTDMLPPSMVHKPSKKSK